MSNKFHHIALWLQMGIVCCLIGINVSDHVRLINTLDNIESWIAYSQVDQSGEDCKTSSSPCKID